MGISRKDRLSAVERVLGGERAVDVAAVYGVRDGTVRQWVLRYRDEVQRRTGEFTTEAPERELELRLEVKRGAREAIGRLRPGLRLAGLTKGQFSLLDLIRVILEQTGPADVIMATWTAGLKDVSTCGWLLRGGQIRSLRMMIDRSLPTRHPKYAARLVEVFGDDALCITNSHAKFILIENDEWHLCLRTSMNLNQNKRFESFDLDESAELCAFYRRFYDEVRGHSEVGLGASGGSVGKAFRAAFASEPTAHKSEVTEDLDEDEDASPKGPIEQLLTHMAGIEDDLRQAKDDRSHTAVAVHRRELRACQKELATLKAEADACHRTKPSVEQRARACMALLHNLEVVDFIAREDHWARRNIIATADKYR